MWDFLGLFCHCILVRGKSAEGVGAVIVGWYEREEVLVFEKMLLGDSDDAVHWVDKFRIELAKRKLIDIVGEVECYGNDAVSLVTPNFLWRV